MFKKVLVISTLLFVPSLVFGASYASFPAQEVKYTEGQAFQIPIYIGSNDGEKIFTAKISLAYDPAFLEVVSFALKDGSFPLVQEGYDKTDNTNGILIKTAGYVGGVSAQGLFGTATFKSKKAGSTQIRVSDDALLLNASNQNTIGSKGAVTVVLSPAQEEVIREPEVRETMGVIQKGGEADVSQAETSTVQIPEKMNPVLFAALSLLVVVNPFVFMVLALASLIGVFYLIRRSQSKKR